MANQKFYDRFDLDWELAGKVDFNTYYPLIGSALADPLIINNEEFINLASNNYLGLANDRRVKEAVKKATDDFGLSLCATPIAGGYNTLLRQLQEKLSVFTGVEDCVIFPSCYQANNSLFGVIATKNDLILVDHYAHSSLVEGIKSSPAKLRPFLHNNTANLESILSKSDGYDQVFVVTESVFSTEGSLAPLSAINELCNKYNAVFVIDDSHGLGVIGKQGKGALSFPDGFKGILTASLGKAIAGSGGMVGGSKKLMEYMRYYCPHLIYSTAIVPPVTAGILKVLEIIGSEFDAISERMYRNKNTIEQALISAGFKTIKNSTPIISIEAGNSEQTINLACRFYRNKILTTPFVHPSVPEKQGRLRLIAGANLSLQTIEKAAGIIEKMKPV